MFPFSEEIELKPGLVIPHQEVLNLIWPLLTMERRAKIEKVLEGRTYNNVVVLEGIYDRGNASAVMRSAEAFGFAQIHMIELGDKFKESQRTTAGADKWVELQKWKSTQDCVSELKRQGKQIVVTHLDSNSKPISEIDFSIPTALVLGNEKHGASQEIIEAADHCVIVPMGGFVQSFNISVAGALCFYQMYLSRVARLGQMGDLSSVQKQVLKAVYAARTLDSTADILEQQLKNKSN